MNDNELERLIKKLGALEERYYEAREWMFQEELERLERQMEELEEKIEELKSKQN